MKKTSKIILSVLLFIILIVGWELYVSHWQKNESGPIIRVDILIIYPISVILSLGTYYLLGRINK